MQGWGVIMSVFQKDHMVIHKGFVSITSEKGNITSVFKEVKK